MNPTSTFGLRSLRHAAAPCREMFRNEEATTAVEFALVAPFAIVGILSTLQFAIILFAQTYFEDIAERTARTLLTRQANSITSSPFKNSLCANLTALFDCANVSAQLTILPYNVSDPTPYLPNISGGVVSMPAGAGTVMAGQDVMVLMTYKWPVIGGPLGFNLANLADGSRLMTSVTIFRVEP